MANIRTDRQALELAPDPMRDRMEHLAPGLYLRVKRSGARAYVLRMQHGGKDRWRVVGHPPAMPLAEALALAHARRVPGAQAPTSTLSCADAVDLFLRQYIAREWATDRNARVYGAWLRSELASTPLRMLARDRLVQVVQAYATRPTARRAARGGRVSQNRLLAFAKLWLGWCVECGYLATNPADGLTARIAGGAEISRDRVLSLNEMRALWAMPEPHGPMLRALLLTGCRISELQGARVRDVVADVSLGETGAAVGDVSLTIAHTKNGKPHRVPLTGLVLAQIAQGAADGPLFPESAVSATAVQAWLRRWHEANGTEPWTPHDLRRTFATVLSAEGVPIETISRCLNHTLAGPTAVYVRDDRYAERRAAHAKLDAWVRQNIAAKVEFRKARR